MKKTESIKISGARVNNLKDISLEIPLNKMTCFFGPSGSGKTSIAFHTLFSESKRRFLNSFPSFLKFFSDRPAPVDVDEIFPVLPVFGLPQNNPVVGTRSNVADTMHLTELYQNLFYHYSVELCPIHKEHFIDLTIVDYLKSFVDLEDEGNIYYLLITKDSFLDHFQNNPFPSRSLKSTRSKKISDFSKDHELWELGRFKLKHLERLNEKFKDYFQDGIELFLLDENNKKLHKLKYKKNETRCPVEGCTERSVGKLTLSHFSPYNALGACADCNGFGETLTWDPEKLFDENRSVQEGGVLLLKYKRFAGQEAALLREMKKQKISITKPIKDLGQKFQTLLYEGGGSYHGFDEYFRYLERKRYKMTVRIFIRNIQKGERCSRCQGTRMEQFSKNFFMGDDSLYELLQLTLGETAEFFSRFQTDYNIPKEQQKQITKINDIISVALGVGLSHLSLMRKAKSLSAGEYQRLLLLKYLSYDGKDSLFVFDEPSLGLNISEKEYLLDGFNKLIQQGNTVVLIDHSKFFRSKSDYIIQMGPGSGREGGEIMFQGTPSQFKPEKLTLDLKPLVHNPKDKITVVRPELYNKTYPDFIIKTGHVNLVRGPSGSGKTAAMINTLANKLNYDVYGDYLDLKKGKAESISYSYPFTDVIVVDANLNRYTSRSTVGSLTDLFPVVRKHFVNTQSARALGLKEGHFSYNSDLGQCPNCEGKGFTIVEMQFLEDIVLTCEDCKGKRLKPIYADISDGRFTVHEAFSSPLNSVLEHIRLTPKFKRIFEYLKVLNLDYLSLNRAIQSLSGGEKQRIYLLSKLQKNLSGSIIFFENISFGLSDKELVKVCELLQTLTVKGNTVVLIDQDEIFEHIAQHKIMF
ncbi:MAG: hypothetical protein CME62_02580 [Halobacteriovoraceae bacterium]|nr:hypothetical protein [Halobacteriovoraceae bacterium]